jgi:acetolactate synthase-1/2/3 large subunit
MRASDLLVACLENEGVKYIFGIPGEETLDLMESLEKSSITFIVARHEQAAAFMADTYGRLTGKAGVCVSTLGPGATNLLTGIADANLDRAPLVAITGQSDLNRIHKESHQYINIVENFETVTKWNARIEAPEVIPELVRKAFKMAETEKPGAVHLELPENIAEKTVDETYARMIPPIRARRSSPDRKSLRHAADLIENSAFPVILAGHGVVRKNADVQLQKHAEMHGIPAVTTFMGKGALTAKSPCYIGTLGLFNDRLVEDVFKRADLIIAVGYGLVEYAPKNWNPTIDKKIIHIDFTTSEVDIHYIPEVEIVSDIRESLELLDGMISMNRKSSYIEQLRTQYCRNMEAQCESGWPVKPQQIIHAVRSVLGDDDILISDVGTHKMWVAKHYPVYRSNSLILSNGFAAMGFALPSAIAAKLVYPEKRVAAICGDGGFLMNVQEIETACRLKLNIVIIVFNSRGFNLIEWKLKRKCNSSFGTGFANPDFIALANSFGAHGVDIGPEDDIESVIHESFSKQCPVIINVEIDYSNNDSLFSML